MSLRYFKFVFIILTSLLFYQASFSAVMLPAKKIYPNPRGNGILPWRPTGSFEQPVSAQCRPSGLTEVLNSSNFEANLQEWMDRCDQENWPVSRSYNRHATLQRLDAIDYEVEKNPYIQPVKFRMNSGRIVQGLIAMKPSAKPLPLIVARCGVFCNASNGAVTTMVFTHFFEEGPFNVLMLGSNSGVQFAWDNRTLTAGGFEEGAQMIEIIDSIQKSHIRQNISEYHIFGVSLGGHSALYASRLAEERKDLPIRSAIALVPVVNLKDQLELIFSRNIRGRVFQFLTKGIFRNLVNYIPFLGDRLNQTGWSDTNRLKALVSTTLRALSEKNSYTQFPKFFEGYSVDSESEFYRLADYRNFAFKPGIPTLIVYAVDDFVVDTEINANSLKNLGSLPNTSFLKLNRGNHGAFDFTLGWPVFSTLVNGYFKKYSKSIDADAQIGVPIGKLQTSAWTKGGDLKDVNTNKRLGIKFVEFGLDPFKDKADQVQVRMWVRIFKPTNSLFENDDSCLRYDGRYSMAPDSCFEFQESTLDGQKLISEFGLEDLSNMGKWDEEALQRLRMWLQTQVKPKLNQINVAEVSSFFGDWYESYLFPDILMGPVPVR